GARTVAQPQFYVAEVTEGHRVHGSQPGHLLSRFERFLESALSRKPFGQLAPGPVKAGIFRERSAHLPDGFEDLSALGFNPGRGPVVPPIAARPVPAPIRAARASPRRSPGPDAAPVAVVRAPRASRRVSTTRRPGTRD